MNSSVLIHKKPGLLVPDALLKKASVSHPTAFGFCSREGGELKTEVVTTQMKMDELVELQNAFKAEDLVLFFANFPKAVLPDDAQPWVMNDTHGNPFLGIFCEGDARDYEGLDGDHTGEYCASSEIIFDRLLKAGQAAEDDVDKLILELNKPGLQKVLTGTFSERGAYVLMTRKGPPIIFGDHKIGKEYSWGFTSNTLGYVEAAASEPVKEAAKGALSFLRGRSASSEAAPATTPAVEDPKPDVKPEEGKPSVPTVTPGYSVPEMEAKGYKRMFPPPKMGRGKARNLWIRTFNCIPSPQGHFGQLPADHESSTCAVWVQPELFELSQRVATSKGDVDNLATSVHKFRQGGSALGIGKGGNVTPEPTAAEKNATVVAELARDELVGKGAAGEKPITRSTVRESARNVLVMSDKMKELAMQRMAGYLDKARPRPSPLELQKVESKHANYSESTGTTFEERLFFTGEQLSDLFDGNEIAVSFTKELMNRYIQDTGVKLGDLAVPKSYPEQEEPEVEPEKEVIPEPAKKSGALSFLRGKQAA